MTAIRVAIQPDPTDATGRVRPDGLRDDLAAAVRSGGGEAVELGEPADGLVWANLHDTDGLRAALAATPEIRWVQLAAAGIESVAGTGLLSDGRSWTCAKGSYADPVAEHALLLALAGLRVLYRRIGASHWGQADGLSLFDEPVTILGGGGIAQSLVRLVTPMRVPVTVVRRSGQPFPGAARTVTTDRLHEVLPGALVVFVALSLTPETMGIIGTKELELMDERAWLVNVGRGRHVDTDALVSALEGKVIAGAGLDVTDPEPLPDGHRLWSLPNAIITPHTADTEAMTRPLLAARVTANVRHLVAGEPLEGLIDPVAGY